MLINKEQLLREMGLKGTVEINQSIYFRNALTLKQKSKNVFVKWNLKDALLWRSVLLLFLQETGGCEFVPDWYVSGDFLRLDRLYLSRKITASLPRTWSLTQIFSGTLKKVFTHSQQKAVWRGLHPHFQEKRECGRSLVILWVLYVCYHLGECRNIGLKKNHC